ncbi:MAG: GAF domain-containing protein [Bacteroidales bacterium]|nr:GAF domain-containing protein [Bacteroidales bacterium]
MKEELAIHHDLSKEEKYKELIPQLKSLLSSETDSVANYANVSAALKEAFGFFWVGFYRVENDELLLGPFQGKIACTRIQYGKGVCGTAWKEKRTIIVPDVEKFEGHIACNSASRSEIVVPVIRNDRVLAVLDIDSDVPDDFDPVDAAYLEEIINLLP